MLFRPSPFEFTASDFGGQCVQLRLPMHAKLRYPLVDLAHWCRLEGVDAPGAFRSDACKPVFPENSQVLRYSRLSYAEFGMNDIDDLAG
jgi:hypothetical protein